jgi:hypothetical protein
VLLAQQFRESAAQRRMAERLRGIAARRCSHAVALWRQRRYSMDGTVDGNSTHSVAVSPERLRRCENLHAKRVHRKPTYWRVQLLRSRTFFFVRHAHAAQCS